MIRLCWPPTGCGLVPGGILGVSSTQHKAQAPAAGNQESSCQLPTQRIQGQRPGTTPRGNNESYFAHAAHRSKVWAEWWWGVLSANGQLVTKPTSFLKLGHRRETGTAELSPNRTVAHLVPGPSGTPGREGGGEHRWLLPRLGSLEGRKVNITAVTADTCARAPPPHGRSKSWKVAVHSHSPSPNYRVLAKLSYL